MFALCVLKYVLKFLKIFVLKKFFFLRSGLHKGACTCVHEARCLVLGFTSYLLCIVFQLFIIWGGSVGGIMRMCRCHNGYIFD